MIYPANFEQKIGFDIIKNLLSDFCISSLGKYKIEQIQFSPIFEDISRMQEEVEEFRQILLFESSFPSQDYFDLNDELQRLKLEGTFIEIEQLCNLRASLQTVSQCLSFFDARQESGKYPRLTFLSQAFVFDKEIIQRIDNIVDDKGNIKDSSSDELLQIRKQMHRLESDISKNIKKILQQSKQNQLIDDSAEITIRNGRFVLPVPAVNKRKIKGFVHDESASGQTFFIEPQEVFESNNLLHNLFLDERREIIRVLTQFTNLLRPQIPYIKQYFDYLGTIDFIRAKAKLALHINAVKPIIENKAEIQWKKAVHPLLYLSHKEQNKTVVPLDIHLGKEFKILIISGPNAGGKSVCLKTLALLQYMFQCGLPVSTSELSEFGIFDDILIDIGDEQSIDDDLSTYSSHLKNMQAMVEQAKENSLFLMDELGGGTDPQYGGAIAEALLEFLAQKNTCGLVTTHFGNLKMLAEKHPNIQNGAMLFDEVKMTPLFILKIGQYGTSFTFEIAEKTGLDKHIIDQAIQKAGRTQIRYEKLLHRLTRKQQDLDKRQKMIEFTDQQLSELIQEYKIKDTELKQQRAIILKQARNEAKLILKDANKLIEKAVREVKESKADKEVSKKARQDAQEFVQKIEQIEQQEEEKIESVLLPSENNDVIRLHDMVLIEDTQTIGEVTSISDDEVVVSFNSIQLRTSLGKIRKVSKTEQKKINKSSGKTVYASLANKVENFKLQLDIRGMRVEEALKQLEQYLDDAILLSVRNVSILHGKGNGILRLAVRDYLAKNKQVKTYYDEHVERGGHGITIVELY
jgi:DNA mismatch repair protein MutS2